MRHFTSLLAILLVACGAQAKEPMTQIETTPWPIESKTERVKYMLSLDDLDNEILGDPGYVDPKFTDVYADISGQPEDEIVSGINEVYVESEEAWHKFVWLCNESREKEAMEFYRDNHVMVDFALRHSLVRYKFHDNVIGYMAYEYLDVIAADELMMDVLSFDFGIISGTYMLNEDESYLDVMNELCSVLVYMYRDNERYDDILHLYDIWLESSGYHNYPDVLASVNLSRANIYFYPKQDPETALKYLHEAKANAEEYFKQGGDDIEMREMLSNVEKFIEVVNKL